MTESYYFPAIKVNAKIAEIIDSGHHIEIAGYIYERLTRKPRGRSIARKLFNTNTNERFVIYG